MNPADTHPRRLAELAAARLPNDRNKAPAAPFVVPVKHPIGNP